MTTSTLVRVLIAAAAFSLAHSTARAQPNLVVNGGFETGTFSGWRLSGNSGFLTIDRDSAQAGNFGVFTGPFGSPALLSQTLTTVPGATYTLEYWLANFDVGPNQFYVTWGGRPVGTAINNAGPFGYTRFTVSGLVATATTTTLTFAFQHEPSFFAFDSVSVYAAEIPKVADIAMVSATTPDSQSVNFTFVAEATTVPFVVNVYRSSNDQFDAATDVLVGSTTVTNPSTGSGSVVANLGLDPLRPYVLVVADPANAIEETSEANNTASFQKRILGIITPGSQVVGNLPSLAGMPEWVGEMASALQQRGYAKVVSFDWSVYSNAVLPGQTTAAALVLANEINAAVGQLGLAATDVLDTHWIGHSRGAVVNSHALATLLVNGTMPPAVSRGWMKMTMLDPHPARNGPTGPLCSFDSGSPIGWLLYMGCAAFQAITRDPDAVFPSRVNQPEVYFQHTSYANAPSWQRFLNLWGVSTILPNSVDWTHAGIGHSEIPEVYRLVVIESFGSNGPAVGSSGTPASGAPTNQPADEIGMLYPAHVDNRGLAESLTAKLTLSRTLLDRGNTRAARGVLEAFINEVQAQRGAHIKNEAADLFVAAAQSSLSALR